MNVIWEEWIDSDAPPPRACCETKLAQSNYLLEVMIIATRKKSSGLCEKGGGVSLT